MPHQRARAACAVVAASAALWGGWRYDRLGREIAANRHALAMSLLPTAADSLRDASGRVARVVAANEALFDETLALAAYRRAAGWLALTGVGTSLCLGAWTWRRSGAFRQDGR